MTTGTRLHVFLGAGGVGKTTLAAGYAMALARGGARVGLLGIDPARRLQGALALTLPDLEVRVPVTGELRAAVFAPGEALRRWAEEACPEPDLRARLVANAFFLALADRLAGAADVLAAIRIAEWLERDPGLAHLVVDTAPGLNAIEFLRRPQVLTAFLEGRLVGWLRRLDPARRAGRGTQRVLDSLARIGGTRLLGDLAEFLALTEGVIARMLARLDTVRAALRGGTVRVLLITTVREDAAVTARHLAAALRAVDIPPSAVVLNRALPEGTERALARCIAPEAPGARALVHYAQRYAAMQARVRLGVESLAPATVALPAVRGLDGEDRLAALGELGALLHAGLAHFDVPTGNGSSRDGR